MCSMWVYVSLAKVQLRVRYGWIHLMRGKGWGRSSGSLSWGRWPAVPEAKLEATNDEYLLSSDPTCAILPGQRDGWRLLVALQVMTDWRYGWFCCWQGRGKAGAVDLHDEGDDQLCLRQSLRRPTMNIFPHQTPSILSGQRDCWKNSFRRNKIAKLTAPNNEYLPSANPCHFTWPDTVKTIFSGEITSQYAY